MMTSKMTASLLFITARLLLAPREMYIEYIDGPVVALLLGMKFTTLSQRSSKKLSQHWNLK